MMREKGHGRDDRDSDMTRYQIDTMIIEILRAVAAEDCGTGADKEDKLAAKPDLASESEASFSPAHLD
jgi:hypothetical protein